MDDGVQRQMQSETSLESDVRDSKPAGLAHGSAHILMTDSYASVVG
jgi:hypothetical protein